MANKKTTKKKVTVVTAIVPQSEVLRTSDLAPEKKGKSYMIPKSWISDKQVIQMVQNTPKKYVYTRPAKGGGTWDYVPGWYVTKVLNFVFGWNWNFEVIREGKEGDQVYVLGKLTVKSEDGKEIVKTQYGRAELKKKESKYMDYGNDLKAAATDSLKKCASMLGIAHDIYGKEEMKKEEVVIEEKKEVKNDIQQDDDDWGAVPAFLRRSKLK